MKTAANYRKYFFYILLLGLVCLIAGLVAGTISGSWLIVPLVLTVIGAILILLYLVLWMSNAGGFWGKRSTEIGANAIIATAAIIAILGLVNFVALRYSIRLDLTENQLFTLSPQSQQLVENLDQPLKVWIFDRAPDLSNEDLLNNYRRYSDKFSFELVDPQQEFELAQKFGVDSFGEVYLEYGDKRQLLQTINPEQTLSEVSLTNAIEKIQRDTTPVVYLLQGHGEPVLEATEGGMSQAVAAMEDKGLEVKTLLFSELSQVPEDANLVVVAGPVRKLFEGEVVALQNYLNQGGSLLLLLDPETDPGMKPILEDWGVELDEKVVIDGSGIGSVFGLGALTPVVNNYTDHPITQDFRNGFSLYPLARTVDFAELEGIEASPLLITHEQSWAESEFNSQGGEENLEIEFNLEIDRSGPVNLGFALSRPVSKKQDAESEEKSATESPEIEDKKEAQVEETDSEAKKETESAEEKDSETSSDGAKNKSKETKSRLVVIGDSTFMTNGWFDQQLNGDVFINSVNWLVAEDEQQTFSIRPKEQKDRRLNLTPVQASVLGWTSLLFVPLFGLLSAGFVWLRRR